MAENILKNLSLFAEFNDKEFEQLRSIIRETDFPAQTMIFSEQDNAVSLFVVQAGEIEILKQGAEGTELVVAQLGAGSVFGEMAFVDGARRAASAQTKTNAVLLEINYEDLSRAIEKNPAIGSKIFHAISRTLCERIRQTTTDLSHLLLS